MDRLLVKDDDIELGEEKEERMLQIKERDQCIIHEEGILHNIRPRQSKAVAGRQHTGQKKLFLSGFIFQSGKVRIIHVFSILHNICRRQKVHDYFLLLICKSSIWFTEKHIFKIIIYFFNTSKCAANYVISYEVYDFS